MLRYAISSLVLLASIGCSAERHGDELERPKAEAKAEPKAETPRSRPAAAHAAPIGIVPVEAMARLAVGNARFATGRRDRSTDTADDAAERVKLAGAQHPFAAILTCADSRVPPELLFDQSLGDLFVVRNAGNIAEGVGEGSMEYGVEHLGIRLLVVLGHESCGAVKAVAGADGPLPGHLADIQRRMPLLPAAVAAAKKAGASPEAAIAQAVGLNAREQAGALLRDSEGLRKAVAAGTLVVVPAVYDLDTGLVDFQAPVAIAAAGDAAGESGH